MNPWGVLEQIWADRKKRGMQPRSTEEIDAELNAMRNSGRNTSSRWKRYRRKPVAQGGTAAV